MCVVVHAGRISDEVRRRAVRMNAPSMLRRPTGLALNPSCCQEIISRISSRVPNPPVVTPAKSVGQRDEAGKSLFLPPDGPCAAECAPGRAMKASEASAIAAFRSCMFRTTLTSPTAAPDTSTGARSATVRRMGHNLRGARDRFKAHGRGRGWRLVDSTGRAACGGQPPFV